MLDKVTDHKFETMILQLGEDPRGAPFIKNQEPHVFATYSITPFIQEFFFW